MRIFVEPEQLVKGELRITGVQHHYLGRVRRARVGEAVEVVDGQGRRAAATIASITSGELTLEVGEPETITAKPPHVRVLVPLIKGDRMDVCLEKLVEVGADSIVLWPAERSIVKIDDARRDGRLAKYRAMLEAAARQCGRAHVPTVSYAELTAAIAALPAGDRIVLDPSAQDPLVVGSSADVTLASGPEGGLTADEVEQLVAAGFVAAGLGSRILRAETAPTIAVAVIRHATRS